MHIEAINVVPNELPRDENNAIRERLTSNLGPCTIITAQMCKSISLC
jgi:hypothetical protein